jgi:hypothetical protein
VVRGRLVMWASSQPHVAYQRILAGETIDHRELVQCVLVG